MAQYSTRRFHGHSTQRAIIRSAIIGIKIRSDVGLMLFLGGLLSKAKSRLAPIPIILYFDPQEKKGLSKRGEKERKKEICIISTGALIPFSVMIDL